MCAGRRGVEERSNAIALVNARIKRRLSSDYSGGRQALAFSHIH